MNKGASISYIYSSYVELTRTCHLSCGFCSYKTDDSPLISIEDLKVILSEISKRHATEVILLSGENPQEYPHIQIDLHRNGFSSYTEFLLKACELALEEGLSPVLSVGYLDSFSAQRLTEAGCSVRLDLVCSSLSGKDMALEKARSHNPSAGKASIEALHSAHIPYSVRFVIGLGETADERQAFIKEIGRYCTADPQLQDVRIVPFQPTRGCAMEKRPPLPFDAVKKAVTIAKEVFPVHHLSVPPYLFSKYPDLVEAGLNDLGSVPIITGDPCYENFDIPSFDTMKARLEKKNVHLFERYSLTTPSALNRPKISEAMNHIKKLVEKRNSTGLNLIDNQHCFVCGPKNSLGLNLQVKEGVDGHTCTFTWTPGPAFQGYAGIVHGGILSTLLDESMAYAVMGNDTLAVTAELRVRFLRPAPVGVPLKIAATRVGQRKHLHFARSSVMTLDGIVLAEAEGRFAEI